MAKIFTLTPKGRRAVNGSTAGLPESSNMSRRGTKFTQSDSLSVLKAIKGAKPFNVNEAAEELSKRTSLSRFGVRLTLSSLQHKGFIRTS